MTTWCLFLLAALGARAGGESIQVKLVDGTVVTGASMTLQEDGTLILSDGAMKSETTTTDVLHITWDRGIQQPPVKSPALLLAHGQIVHGEFKAGGDEAVSLTNPYFGEASFPLTSVQGFLLATRLGPRAKEQLVRRLRGLTQSSDALLLSNDDVLKGTITTFGPDEWSIEQAGNTRTVKSDALRGAALDPNLIDEKAPSGIWAEVELVDGSLLRARRIVSGPDAWQLTTTSGSDIAVQKDAVAGMGFFGGRAAYLSDMPFEHSEHRPYLDGGAPPTRDVGVAQFPLAMDDRRIRKGIQVHPYTKIDFSAAGYQRFLATIGVDDAAGENASVVFRLLVDGRVVFESPEMTATSPPLEVNVALSEAKVVSMETDFGRRADVDDLADWGDARLVKDRGR